MHILAGSYKRYSRNAHVHPLLAQHIGHLLRVRILQELEFLADQLQTRPRGATDSPLLRRLTRAEFKLIKTTGVIPDQNAVAVLIVPPLNKSPITKARPVPSASPAFIDHEVTQQDDNTPPLRPLPPLSILYPTADSSDNKDDLHDLSRSQVPLYNGLTLFPSRPQRAALHERLLRLLFIEGRARYREHGPDHSPGDNAGRRSCSDQKASHAFLLRSDSSTLKRADAAVIAIALWRLRMWEGGGWDDCSSTTSTGLLLD
jgi:hypothetical protein